MDECLEEIRLQMGGLPYQGKEVFPDITYVMATCGVFLTGHVPARALT